MQCIVRVIAPRQPPHQKAASASAATVAARPRSSEHAISFARCRRRWENVDAESGTPTKGDPSEPLLAYFRAVQHYQKGQHVPEHGHHTGFLFSFSEPRASSVTFCLFSAPPPTSNFLIRLGGIGKSEEPRTLSSVDVRDEDRGEGRGH